MYFFAEKYFRNIFNIFRDFKIQIFGYFLIFSDILVHFRNIFVYFGAFWDPLLSPRRPRVLAWLARTLNEPGG